jgi:hypothetical protein
MRFNPPPGWPAPPEGFAPGPGWQPDPSWPPAPPGWQFWLSEEQEQADQEHDPDGGLHRIFAPYSQEPRAAWDFQQLSSGYGQPPPVGTSGPRVAPPSSSTSGMAVTAFVLGLLGVVGISAILGIVFGAIALRRIRGTLQRGKGLAIAGIVLGSVWLALTAVVITSAVILQTATPTRPSASASPQAGSHRVNPFSLVAGDCFDTPAVTQGNITSIASVVQTACTEPHSDQIFATFTDAGSTLDYPGETTLRGIAAAGCIARMGATVNSALINKAMVVGYLAPDQLSWLAGRRTISCIIYSPTSMRSSVLKG